MAIFAYTAVFSEYEKVLFGWIKRKFFWGEKEFLTYIKYFTMDVFLS